MLLSIRLRPAASSSPLALFYLSPALRSARPSALRGRKNPPAGMNEAGADGAVLIGGRLDAEGRDAHCAVLKKKKRKKSLPFHFFHGGAIPLMLATPSPLIAANVIPGGGASYHDMDREIFPIITSFSRKCSQKHFAHVPRQGAGPTQKAAAFRPFTPEIILFARGRSSCDPANAT